MLLLTYRQFQFIMEINTLQKSEYRGCNIYVRNFNNVFEYLAIIDGQLYTTHMVVTKSLLQSILGQPYTQKQLEDTVKYLLNVAHATVDYVLDGAENKKK